MIITLRDVENCLIALGEVDAIYPDQDDPGPDRDELMRHANATDWLLALRDELKLAESDLEKQLEAANETILAKDGEIGLLKSKLAIEKAKIRKVQSAMKGIET